MPGFALSDLKSLFKKSAAPTQPITVSNAFAEPDSGLEWMDVDRVGLAIRSARAGTPQLLFALYRDIVLTHSHIQAEFMKRKLAVLGDRFRVLPYDKKVAADVEAADFCEKMIYELKSWRPACAHLLDSCLWPVAVCEKVFRPAAKGRFTLLDLVLVPHYLLDFTTGTLAIRDTDENGNPIGTIHAPDPERYIVHRGHTISSPDAYGGPMRALVYWWLASSMNRDWWVRFLERHGTPFMVGKFKAGNTTDRDVLLAAMSSSRRLFGLAVTTSTTVDLLDASKAGADAFERFHDVGSREISKLILGQTLSSQASPTGELGGGTAGMQAGVRNDIRDFDATLLSSTLRDQLFVPVCQLAGLSGRAPYVMWGSLSQEEIKGRVDVLVALKTAGLEPDDEGLEGLSEDIGFGIRRAPQVPAPMVL